jgi:DNA polymerase III epsilon subunit-like protein
VNRLCFVDCETTSLGPDRRAWEIGIILREPGSVRRDREFCFLIDADDLDLGNADPVSLKVGRFYERHPQYRLDREFDYSEVEPEAEALREVEAITRGAHLVGAVVSFDADVLGQRMRANGILPGWHYHLIDVEALAVGYLAFSAARDGDGKELDGSITALPWKSEALSRALGVDPDDFDRHTALADAKWAMRIYDAVMGGAQ